MKKNLYQLVDFDISNQIRNGSFLTVTTIFIFLNIFLILAACSSSDDTSPPWNPDDIAPYFTVWDAPPKRTTDSSVSFGGNVFDEYGYLPACPINPYYPPLGVTIKWLNTSSGESGSRPANWVFIGHSALSGCTGGWNIYDIPLVWGNNEIVISATGDSGKYAEMRFNIQRVPESPEDFTYEVWGDAVTFNWQKGLPGASSYKLYYSINQNFSINSSYLQEDASVISIPNITPDYVLKGLEQSVIYYFAIAGVTNDGTVGIASKEISTSTADPGWQFCSSWDIGSYRNAPYYFDLSIDNTDIIHMLFQGKDILGQAYPPRYMTNSSDSWESTFLDFGYYATLELDDKGTPNAVIENDNDLMHSSTDSSGNWISTIIHNFSTPRALDLIMEKNIAAHVSYYSKDGLMYATNSTGTWSSTLLVTGEYDIYKLLYAYSKILLDSRGNVHILYVSNDTSRPAMYVSNKTGQWMHEILNITDLSMNMLLDVTDSVHIIYKILDDSNFNILVKNEVTDEWVAKSAPTISGVTRYTTEIDSQGFLHFVYTTPNTLGYANNVSGQWQYNKIHISPEKIHDMVFAINSANQIDIFAFKENSLNYATNNPTQICGSHIDTVPPSEDPLIEIPGTYSFDIDSGSIVSFFDIKSDIFWEQISSTERRLLPTNGAEVYQLGGPNYYDVDSDSMHLYNYSANPLYFVEASSIASHIDVGETFFIRTGSGNYHKVQIVDFQPEQRPEGGANFLTIRYHSYE